MLPAPQIAPRTKVALQSRQFSSSSSADTPRTSVVLQSHQFSASSSTDAVPATKSVLHGGSQSAQLPAPRNCSAYLEVYYKVASSQLPAHEIAALMEVALQSRQCSASTKSAPRGSQSAALATNSATWRFTKCCACHEICTSQVHKVLHLPRNLHMEVHKVLCLPRNLHFKSSNENSNAQCEGHDSSTMEVHENDAETCHVNWS